MFLNILKYHTPLSPLTLKRPRNQSEFCTLSDKLKFAGFPLRFRLQVLVPHLPDPLDLVSTMRLLAVGLCLGRFAWIENLD
jgi:hypothetical protein